jgi:manganese oxidase
MCFISRNEVQTVPPQGQITYTWNPEIPEQQQKVVPAGETLGPVLLQDMAYVRNHRHHGLIGALIIEKARTSPYYVASEQPTATDLLIVTWNGPRATVVLDENKSEHFEEAVMLLLDGLRFFLHGMTHLPVADDTPANGEDEVDHEDQGQKAFIYRSELLGALIDLEL